MRRLLVVATVALLATSAAAHENAKGPNGGPVIDSAGHHLELDAAEVERVHEGLGLEQECPRVVQCALEVRRGDVA